MDVYWMNKQMDEWSKEINELYTCVWKTQAKVPNPHICVCDKATGIFREKERAV